MAIAVLRQREPDNRGLCGSELKSIFASSHDPNRRRVSVLFEIVESLAQLADEFLKLADFRLPEEETELHKRAAGLARELGSILHGADDQRLLLNERKADGVLSGAKAEEYGDQKIRPLTRRQCEVLKLLVKGMSNKEIARALGLGEGTVKIHMSGLFRALHVSNRAGAAFVGAELAHTRARTA
jgi:DNA-binding CsgD family transcriptional regulator